MKIVFSTLLPVRADNTICGMKLPIYVFACLAGISTVRSCIHVFAPDGGAGSIAGMDLSVAGARGIVFGFALWGSAQLIYAFIQLAVALRYRSLVSAMYLLLFVEAFLRMLVGHLKPVVFARRPTGAIANYILLPLSLLMLGLSLWPRLPAVSGPGGRH
jgi:hypothetical protein